MDGAFAQAGAGIAHVSFRIGKVSFVSINIDCRSFCFHCELFPVVTYMLVQPHRRAPNRNLSLRARERVLSARF